MSKLSAFLNPVTSSDSTAEVVISNRFVDEKGNPIPFKVRAITQGENEAIIRKATTAKRVKGQLTEHVDNLEVTRQLVVAATVYPDFRDPELCQGFGVMDPLEVPGKMLLVGEYKTLLSAISEVSGFDIEGEDLEEEAKN